MNAYESGMGRIAFTASKFLKDYGRFINVHGDEPLIDPKLIDKLSVLEKAESFEKLRTLESGKK
jgi:CMP-2-keto-3-deoxyoctulosonic acid synthetase